MAYILVTGTISWVFFFLRPFLYHPILKDDCLLFDEVLQERFQLSVVDGECAELLYGVGLTIGK